jgi:hypothetical protein
MTNRKKFTLQYTVGMRTPQKSPNTNCYTQLLSNADDANDSNDDDGKFDDVTDDTSS